jgi:hypothetical protein
MILANVAIATPQADVASPLLELTNGAFKSLNVQADFAYGSGGATVSAFAQTSLDGGNTWVDVAAFGFATASGIKAFNLSTVTATTSPIVPTSGGLASNTAIAGIAGNLWRALVSSTGTYNNTTLRIDLVPRGPFSESAT